MAETMKKLERPFERREKNFNGEEDEKRKKEVHNFMHDEFVKEGAIVKKKSLVKELKDILKKQGVNEEEYDRMLETSPIFYDENALWWAWDKDNFCWKLVDEVSVLNLAQDFFHFTSEEMCKKSHSIIKILQLKSRRKRPQDMPNYCIQFKNKIYNLETKQEFLATPKYFLTSPIPWELSQSDETPTIDKLFIEWVGETWKPTLYEALSYCCIKEKFLQMLIALCGAGSNGKGTFQNLIVKFLGNANCVSSNIKSLINRSFETSALYKKLFCLLGEADSQDLTNTNLIKSLTGEDLIRYEFKGKTPFTEKSATTFIIATNSLPMTPDKSDGFYRRMLCIDFPNQFKIKKDLLSTIPEQEFSNLARKVVNTLKKLLKEQEFSNAGTIEDRKRRYEERANPLMMFISEKCTEDPEEFMPLRRFSIAYNEFLQSKKLRVVSVVKIGKLLREEGFDISPRNYNTKSNEKISRKSIIGLNFRTGYVAKTSSLGSQKELDDTPHPNSTTQTTEFQQVAETKENDKIDFSELDTKLKGVFDE